MKCDPKLKRSDFWKIQCLDCGMNCELLTDDWKRIICHDCLVKNEFNEVENEIHAESDSEMDEIPRKQENGLLRDSDIAFLNDCSSGIQELIKRNGKT